MGITEVMFALSLGSLVFSGELAPFLPYGIGLALFTAAAMMIGVSLTSSVPGVISSTQDSPSVILAVMATGLVGTLSAASAAAKLNTVLAAIAVTTLLTGIFFLALGFFKLGGLVRFIPYPVVGGFLAGTGWLLVQGSFGVMASYSLTMTNIPALLQADQLILWVPGVAVALILFFGLRRFRHFLAMPVILLGLIIAFYLALLISGTTVQLAIRQGLLLGTASGQAAWQPFMLQNVSAVSWAAVMGQSGNIAITMVLTLVSLLLNASALELAIREDIDLNRELQAAGIANIVSGLGGGMVGYHALSLSTLSYRIGARGRLAGLVAGLICAAMLWAGSALLTFFPKPILGGVLLFLGLDFLADWVIAGWAKLPRADYAVVLLILVVIGLTNFLIGVGVGLVAMVILFVLSYSRIDVVLHAISGAEMRSNVERCAYHRRALTRLGQQIYILELQGFIFFGTANALLERLRARLSDPSQPPARYVLLDFCRVSGLDSSAVVSFIKSKQLAEAQGLRLALTHVSEKIQHQFERGGLLTKNGTVLTFADLDHGLEWCEEQLLEIEQITTLHVPVTLSAQLADSGFKSADTARLTKFLERVKVKEGDYLLRQGEEADKLYFIELGTVSVCLETAGGQRVRLQTLGLGTAVGEPGLYLGGACTTSVMAESPVTAYRLTRAELSKMKDQDPDLAATFHDFAARLLSERLVATTRLLEATIRS
jgi:sulfate permease, SulP family